VSEANTSNSTLNTQHSKFTKGVFITGTDTGCGKTEVTLGLMQALQERGERVLGMKPVASGALEFPDGMRNEDALHIQAQGSSGLPYEWVNPYVYAASIAPHLAARAAAREIDLHQIAEAFARLAERADRVLVEGVGGWQVPLNARETVADLALRLGLPVILVVGLRLGCINHALLTEASIRRCGAPLLGWVANQIEPQMEAYAGNLETLRERLSAPCLGEVPWLSQPSPVGVAEHLDVNLLSQGSL
jgi:dethiobiotin synthetase